MLTLTPPISPTFRSIYHAKKRKTPDACRLDRKSGLDATLESCYSRLFSIPCLVRGSAWMATRLLSSGIHPCPPSVSGGKALRSGVAQIPSQRVWRSFVLWPDFLKIWPDFAQCAGCQTTGILGQMWLNTPGLQCAAN